MNDIQADYANTVTMVGARLDISWFTGEALKAYALGPVVDGNLHYVVVDANDGSVTTYRANDQSFPALHASRDMWDMPSAVVNALYRTAIRERRNEAAEDQRYRETVALRLKVSELEANVQNAAIDRSAMRTAIMKEMMSRAADIAEQEGFCSEYDRLAKALGYEGREREYDVTVTIQSFDVTVRVTATSEDNAYDEIVESEIDAAIRDHIAVNSVVWDHYETERV